MYDKEAPAEPSNTTSSSRGSAAAAAPYEFYPGSGATDHTAQNIINVPLMPLWRQASSALHGGSLHGTRGSSRSHASSSSSSRRGGGDPGNSSSDEPLGTAGAAGAGSGSGGNATSGRQAFRSAISARLLPALRAFNPSLVGQNTYTPIFGKESSAALLCSRLVKIECLSLLVLA